MTYALTPSPRRIAPDTSTPQRAWARDNLRGLLNLFLPSFLADGETLDEDAIRHDVNHAIAQGFSGTLPMIDWTPPGDPRWEKLHRIIIDEARGRLPVHGIVFNRKPEQDVRLARQLEKLGVEMILMAPTHVPDISAGDLHAAMRERITATDLPVMLYAALGKGRAFDHLGPAGQPLDIYDRLADLPQLAAVKTSQPVTLVSTIQLFDRLADRL